MKRFDKYDKFIVAIVIAYMLFLVVAFSSCYTGKKAANQVAKAILLKPIIAADLTRKAFPCTTIKADTSYRTDTVYDFVEVRCPDTIKTVRVDTFEISESVPVYIRVPVKKEVITLTVTKLIEDSAKIFVLSNQVEVLKADVVKRQTASDKYQDGRNRWRKWCLITWGIIGLIALFKIFRSKIGL